MNLGKRKRTMRGIPLLPVSVGSRAVLLSSGKVIWTSHVVNIQTQTEEQLRFETLNTCYCVKLDMFPHADAAALPVSAAA